MLQPLPCFLAAPGMGLALVDLQTKTVQRGYPIDGGIDGARATARAIACRALGLVAGRENSLADALHGDWAASGGIPGAHLHGGWRSSPTGAAALGHLSLADPHGSDGLPALDWGAIQASLTDRGLILESRASISALLSAAPLCSVLEMRDAAGKVLAEGKGLTEDAALRGVLGEAVERLVAQLPDRDRLFVASARELAAAGLVCPELSASARDLFGPDLPLEWVAAETLSGRAGALPAELVFYPFQPGNAVKAFSAQHTAGLAAGATVGTAVAAALREAVETDAYWLSMRSMRICGRFEGLADTPVPEIRRLVRALAAIGIRTHAGLINFDWPLPIMHVVLESETQTLPALSHGLALGSDPWVALERALLEAIQVFTGLEKVALQYWPEISVGLSRTADPALLWSDPNYARRITAMFEDAPVLAVADAVAQISTIGALDGWMTQQGMTASRAHLGTHLGLDVVRVHIDGAVSPFSERGAPSRRVNELLARYGLDYPYLDPVLT